MKVQDMLERGYFPAEMPPSFSAKNFGSVALSLRASLPKKDWTKPVAFNLARPGSLRRRLGIPNPFSQLTLVKNCSENWPVMEAHLAKSTISLSRPQLAPLGSTRALEFRVPIANRSSERLSRMWRGKFTVRADINDFYASVYTHSLEWALHTKAAAKSNLATKGPTLLGGKLDIAVRAGQEGQTKGIPVGPDSSLLLAELILCEIDAEMQKLVPQSAISAVRLVDDLEFYAKSRAEAEDFLTTWDSRLHAYDLSLNPRKTEIIEGPVAPEKPWRMLLSQLRLRPGSDSVLSRDIQGFFSSAFELSREYPDDQVLGYAINKVRSMPMEKMAWRAFQYAMLASVTADSSSLRFIAPIFVSASTAGRDIDKNLVFETLNQVCLHHSSFEHGSEVAWSLHILRTLGLHIEADVAGQIAKMQDNTSLLLLMDFVSRQAISGPPPDLVNARARAEDPLAYSSEDWLLGYESARNGWTDPKHFVSQAHWNELLKAKVGFFKAAPPLNLKSAPAVVTPNVPKPSPPTAAVKPLPPIPKPAVKSSSSIPIPAAKPSSSIPKAAPPIPTPAPKHSPWSSGTTAPESDPIIDDDDYGLLPDEFY